MAEAAVLEATMVQAEPASAGEAQAEEEQFGPLPPELWPRVDHLVTEDDTPVDNIYSEKQQRLLTESLYASWHERPFLVLANVGLFYAVDTPPLVPDVLLSLDVQPPEDLWEKAHRSYFVWMYGKPPEVVIEIVSNSRGDEAGGKLQRYTQIGIAHYFIYDPLDQLGGGLLRHYQRHGTGLVETDELWMPDVGLGLTLWEGTYEGVNGRWLRWCDEAGQVIPTGAERAEQERQRAEQERQRAEQERQRAERLIAQLRALGVEPEVNDG